LGGTALGILTINLTIINEAQALCQSTLNIAGQEVVVCDDSPIGGNTFSALSTNASNDIVFEDTFYFNGSFILNGGDGSADRLVFDPTASVSNTTINLLGGNDVVLIQSDATNSASLNNGTVINTGEGHDQLTNSGFALDVHMGTGDDQLHNTGSLVNIFMDGGNDSVTNEEVISGNVDLGDGDDLIINQRNIVGSIIAGSGNDRIILRANGIDDPVVQGAVDLTMLDIDGGTGIDSLTLDGSSDALLRDLNGIGNVEHLIMDGSGVWTVEQNGVDVSANAGMPGSAGTFINGVQINSGTMLFRIHNSPGHTSLLNSNVQNFGTVAGDVAFGNAGFTFSNLTDNTRTGTVTANMAFGSGDDTFVNNGIIRPSVGLNTSDGLSVGEGIHLGGGDDIFENNGFINGGVSLDGGADRFILTNTNLFDQGNGLILGGADIDTLVLSGSGGSLFEVNQPTSNIREFESLEIDTTGVWDFNSTQVFSNDITVTNGTLLIDATIGAANLIVNGGVAQVGGVDSNGNSVSGNLTVTGTTTVNGGLLTVHDVGILVTPNLNIETGGVLGGTGTIGTANDEVDVVVNGTVSPNTVGTVGVLTINGDLTIGSTGVLHLDVDPGAGTNDMIMVAGDIDIDQGATVVFDPGSQTVADGAVIILADYTGNTTGTFTTVNSPFVSHSIDYDTNNQIRLTVNSNGGRLGPKGYGSNLNGNENQIATGTLIGAVQTLTGNVMPGGNINQLVGSSGTGLDQGHSELYGASIYSIQKQGNSFTQAMIDRNYDREHCGTLRGFGQESCRPMNSIAPDSDLWMEVIARSEDTDSKLALKSEISSWSVFGGYDSRIAETTFGFSGGVSFSTLEDTLGDSDSASIHIGGFFSQPLTWFNLDGMGSYSFGTFDATRKVSTGVFSGNGTVENNVSHLSGTLMLTQEYQNGGGLEIQPEIGISYDRLTMDGFNEGGNLGNLALTVGDFEWTDVSLRAGLHVRQAYKSVNATIIPEFRVMYKESILEDNYELNTRFTSFATSGVCIITETPKSTWSVGAGVNYENGAGMVLFGDVDYNFSDISDELAAQIGLRIRF
jgi:hypothetical protein